MQYTLTSEKRRSYRHPLPTSSQTEIERERTWGMARTGEKVREKNRATSHGIDLILDNLEMCHGEDLDHFFSKLYIIRDQLRDIGKDVHPMGLTALVVNVVPRIFEPV